MLNVDEEEPLRPGKNAVDLRRGKKSMTEKKPLKRSIEYQPKIGKYIRQGSSTSGILFIMCVCCMCVRGCMTWVCVWYQVRTLS